MSSQVVSVDESQFQKILKNHTSYSCGVADCPNKKVFKLYKHYCSHSRCHPKPRAVFVCNLCRAAFSSRSLYREHWVVEHHTRFPPSSPAFGINQLPKGSAKKPSIRTENEVCMFLMDKYAQYQCIVCQEIFDNRQDLNHHMAQLHPESVGRNILCKLCLVPFPLRSTFSKHWETDHADVYAAAFNPENSAALPRPAVFIPEESHSKAAPKLKKKMSKRNRIWWRDKPRKKKNIDVGNSVPKPVTPAVSINATPKDVKQKAEKASSIDAEGGAIGPRPASPLENLRKRKREDSLRPADAPVKSIRFKKIGPVKDLLGIPVQKKDSLESQDAAVGSTRPLRSSSLSGPSKESSSISDVNEKDVKKKPSFTENITVLPLDHEGTVPQVKRRGRPKKKQKISVKLETGEPAVVSLDVEDVPSEVPPSSPPKEPESDPVQIPSVSGIRIVSVQSIKRTSPEVPSNIGEEAPPAQLFPSISQQDILERQCKCLFALAKDLMQNQRIGTNMYLSVSSYVNNAVEMDDGIFDNTEFACKLCELKYTDTTSTYNHLVTSHTCEEHGTNCIYDICTQLLKQIGQQYVSFRCCFCPLVVTSCTEFVQHRLMTRHLGPLFGCRLCSDTTKEFLNLASLKSHVNKFHGINLNSKTLKAGSGNENDSPSNGVTKKFEKLQMKPISIADSNLQSKEDYTKLISRLLKLCTKRELKECASMYEYRCATCFETFSTIPESLTHKRITRHETFNIVCLDCTFVYDTLKDYMLHLVFFLCKKRFSAIADVAQQPGPKQHDSPACLFNSRISQYAWLASRGIAQDSSFRRARCLACLEFYFTTADMVAHTQKVQHSVFANVCFLCGQGFLLSQQFGQHLMQHVHSGNHFEMCLRVSLSPSKEVPCDNLHRLKIVNSGLRVGCVSWDDDAMRIVPLTKGSGWRNPYIVLRCHVCSEVFNSPEDFLTHSQIASHRMCITMCILCEQEMSVTVDLDSHVDKHLLEKWQAVTADSSPQPSLPDCDKSQNCWFNNRITEVVNALSHGVMLMLHFLKFVCLSCKETFMSVLDVEGHRLVCSKYPGFAFECQFCFQHYTHHAAATYHLLTHSHSNQHIPECFIVSRDVIAKNEQQGVTDLSLLGVSKSVSIQQNMDELGKFISFRCLTCLNMFPTLEDFKFHQTRNRTHATCIHNCSLCGRDLIRLIDFSGHIDAHLAAAYRGVDGKQVAEVGGNDGGGKISLKPGDESANDDIEVVSVVSAASSSKTSSPPTLSKHCSSFVKVEDVKVGSHSSSAHPRSPSDKADSFTFHYKCVQCLKIVPSLRGMFLHRLASSHTQFLYFCFLCKKSFSMKTSANQHIQTFHSHKKELVAPPIHLSGSHPTVITVDSDDENELSNHKTIQLSVQSALAGEKSSSATSVAISSANKTVLPDSTNSCNQLEAANSLPDSSTNPVSPFRIANSGTERLQLAAGASAASVSSSVGEKTLELSVHMQCPECGQRLRNRKDLAQHQTSTGHSKLLYVCSHCDTNSPCLMTIMKHLTEEHLQIPIFFESASDAVNSLADAANDNISVPSPSISTVVSEKTTVDHKDDDQPLPLYSEESGSNADMELMKCKACSDLFGDYETFIQHIPACQEKNCKRVCATCSKVVMFPVWKPPTTDQKHFYCKLHRTLAPARSNLKNANVDHQMTTAENVSISSVKDEHLLGSVDCLLCHKVFKSDVEIKHHLSLTNHFQFLMNREEKKCVPTVCIQYCYAPQNSLYMCGACCFIYETKAAFLKHVSFGPVPTIYCCASCSFSCEEECGMSTHLVDCTTYAASDRTPDNFANQAKIKQSTGRNDIICPHYCSDAKTLSSSLLCLYKCGSCSSFYPTPELFMEHRTKRHTSAKLFFQCGVCLSSFQTVSKFKYHIVCHHCRRKHGDFCAPNVQGDGEKCVHHYVKNFKTYLLKETRFTRYACRVCHIEFATVQAMFAHFQAACYLRISHAQFYVLCGICGTAFSQLQNLLSHQYQHQCQYNPHCNLSPKQREIMQNIFAKTEVAIQFAKHKAVTATKLPPGCNPPEDEELRVMSLCFDFACFHTHARKVAAGDFITSPYFKYVCGTCNEKFETFDAFKSHTVYSEHTHCFMCSECGQIFKDRYHLAHHMAHHACSEKHRSECFTLSSCESDVAPAICFQDSVQNMLMYKEKANYLCRLVCTVCHYCFSSENAIVEHRVQQRHYNLKFCCLVCNRGVKDVHTFVTHMAQHGCSLKSNIVKAKLPPPKPQVLLSNQGLILKESIASAAVSIKPLTVITSEAAKSDSKYEALSPKSFNKIFYGFSKDDKTDSMDLVIDESSAQDSNDTMGSSIVEVSQTSVNAERSLANSEEETRDSVVRQPMVVSVCSLASTKNEDAILSEVKTVENSTPITGNTEVTQPTPEDSEAPPNDVNVSVDCPEVRTEFSEKELEKSTMPVGFEKEFLGYECKCGNTYDTLPQFKNSCSSHGKPRLKCNVCMFWNNNRHKMFQHIANNHRKYIVDKFVDRLAPGKMALLPHQASPSETVLKWHYRCSRCELAFPWIHSFQKHFYEKHK